MKNQIVRKFCVIVRTLLGIFIMSEVYGLVATCSFGFAGERQFTGFSLDFNSLKSGTKLADGTEIKSEKEIPFKVIGNGISAVKGFDGTALRLDGSAKLQAAKEYSELTPGKSDYTLSCWVRLAKGDKGGPILVKRWGSEWVTLDVTNGEVRYTMGLNPANYVAIVRWGKVSEEEWHYVVAVNKRDGDGVLYFDGVEVGRKNLRGQKNTLIGLNAPMEIGNWNRNKIFFKGEIDNLSLKPGLMTPENIRKNFETEKIKDKIKSGKRTVKPSTSFHFRKPETLKNNRLFEIARTERIFARGSVFGERFDGKNSCLILNRSLLNEKEFTLNFWVYLPEVKAGVVLEAPGAFSLDIWHPAWRFWSATPAGQPKPYCRRSYITSPYLNSHEWLMLTVTFGDGEFRVFTNGLGGTIRAWDKFPVNPQPLVFGSSFCGILGGIDFFRTKLTEAEMLEFYRKERTAYTDSLPGIVVSPLIYTATENTKAELPLLFENRTAQKQNRKIAYRILDQRNRSVTASGTLDAVSLEPNTKMIRKTVFPALPAGRYLLEFQESGDPACRFPRKSEYNVIALDKPFAYKENVNDVKKRLIAEFNPDGSYSANIKHATGIPRIVKTSFGTYLELGNGGRLAYRYKADTSKPHLVEFEYPDDKKRDVLLGDACSYNANVGYITGDRETPLSYSMIRKQFLLYPQESDCTLLVLSRHADCSAAIGRVRIYEVTEPLPAQKIITAPDGGRVLGHAWEDAAIYSSYGIQTFPAAEKQRYGSGARIGRMMAWQGANVLRWVNWWYGGAHYRSGVCNLYDSHIAGDSSLFMQGLAPFGVLAQPNFNLLTWPSLLQNANWDREAVAKGTETINFVHADGSIQSNTGEWNASPSVSEFNKANPTFNFADAKVRNSILSIIRETADLWNSYPNYPGPSIEWNVATTLYFGDLQNGYNDSIITQFEKKTGISVPVSRKDPERFAKYYKFLTSPEMRERWIDFRCDLVAELFRDITVEIRKGGAQRTLTISMAPELILQYNANAAKIVQNIVAGKSSILDLWREGGLDFEKLNRIEGLQIEWKYIFGSLYRHRQQDGGFRAQHDIALDIWCYDAKLRVLTEKLNHPSIWCFINYWENFDTAAPPGFWKKQEYKNHGGAVRGGIHTMQPYVRALADCDVQMLMIGGIINPNAYDEDHLRNFARAFRALPKQKLEKIPGPVNPLAIRAGKCGKKSVFYVANREFYPVKATVRFSKAPGTLQDLVRQKEIRVSGKKFHLDVAPYEVLTFYAPSAVRVESASAAISKEAKMYLENMIAELEADAKELQKIKTSPEIIRNFRRIIKDIRADYQNGRFFEARDKMGCTAVTYAENELLVHARELKRNSNRIRISSVCDNSIKVDGNLADWGKLRFTIPRNQANAKIFWDIRKGEKGYFIAVDMPDEKHYQNSSGSQLYFGDSVQFAIDTANNIYGKYIPKQSLSYQSGLSRKGIEFFRENFKTYTPESVAGGQCRIIRDEKSKHTRYEYFLPFSELIPGVNLDAIRFSILVNENNGNGRSCQEFAGGIKEKDTGLFAEITFRKEKVKK